MVFWKKLALMALTLAAVAATTPVANAGYHGRGGYYRPYYGGYYGGYYGYPAVGVIIVPRPVIIVQQPVVVGAPLVAVPGPSAYPPALTPVSPIPPAQLRVAPVPDLEVPRVP